MVICQLCVAVPCCKYSSCHMVIVIGWRDRVGDVRAEGHRCRPQSSEDRERRGMRKGASQWMEMDRVIADRLGDGWPAERWWGWWRGGRAGGWGRRRGSGVGGMVRWVAGAADLSECGGRNEHSRAQGLSSLSFVGPNDTG
jgi:hypothetical protein